MSEPDALVSMRLKDMTRRHPDQDNSRACSKCGETLGLFPSSQRLLATNPSLVLLCVPCALAEHDPSADVAASGSWDVIWQEARESKRVQ
jgi:hypothetical protein